MHFQQDSHGAVVCLCIYPGKLEVVKLKLK